MEILHVPEEKDLHDIHSLFREKFWRYLSARVLRSEVFALFYICNLYITYKIYNQPVVTSLGTTALVSR